MTEATIIGARAVAVILRGDQVLLMKRVKAGGEYFIFGGGTVEPGETKEQAVVREVAEEFSLDVSDPQFLFELVNDSRHEFWFLIESDHGVPTVGGPEKERSSASNQYIPTWYSATALKDLTNLYPQSGQLQVVEWITKHLV